ncbi:MAG: ornithine carbamoyltransferase [Rickettsiales bacterium]|jgi:ornithine carbamoyltransferase|nr:ornithine carbamoyltransferase [Rickettsiales bacterium]
MPVNLKGRSLLTLKDFTKDEIYYLLALAKDLKNKKRIGGNQKLLKNKNIVLIFEKTSTRTRCCFEVASSDEGAEVTFLGVNDSNMAKESIEDTAKVLGRWYDGIAFRGFKQKTVEDLSKFSGVPVWNALTDDYHPTQVLADFLTIQENINKPLDKINFVFVGDGRNNMANSLMIGATKLGMNFTILAPKQLQVGGELLKEIQDLAKHTGTKITLTENIKDVEGADVVYTDVWVSMGEKVEYKKRYDLLKNYQVNMEMLKATNNPDVIFMHCLPSFHDMETQVAQKILKDEGIEMLEVTDEVFRSKHSVVFNEAENRLHTIKSVMVATIG